MSDDLILSNEFYCEEVRCGFNVIEKQKKIWAVELDLLYKLLAVCKKHNIKVYAFAGTLLGAVRHKGFIPWDDDIDVCLLPEDYRKLLEVAETEFTFPYFFQNAWTDEEYHIGFSRLRNSKTTGYIPGNDAINYNNGIFIDVFVLNGYTRNKFMLEKQLFELKFIQKMIAVYHVDHYKNNRPIAYYIGKIEHIFFSYRFLLNLYFKVISRYDNKADRVTLLTHKREFALKYWCQKSDLSEIDMVSFEMIEIPIPNNYDSILKHSYGDYMRFPPIADRGKWHEGVIKFEPDIPYEQYMRSRVTNNEIKTD